uniref:Transmembrane channel-like protein n=1 Tax=Sander lucioperca TaxID=283035 RepID=A0A8C9XQ17_SANLU
MASSFKKNYVLADPSSNKAWQLLSSWDFSITNERAVRQRKNNLRVQLKVTISVSDLHLLSLKWATDAANWSLLQEAKTLLVPFVVSLMNLVVPLFYSLFNKFEHYSSQRRQIYALVVRNVLLKMSILAVLCYYWMNVVCWESMVGQALYRLVIFDFLFLMLGSFFGEFLSK